MKRTSRTTSISISNSWNNGLVATLVLIYEKYITKTYEESNTFEKIQKLMYSVLDNHLNTDKGNAFVSQYEKYCVAQSIHRESRAKKRAFRSNFAHIFR